MSTRPCHTRLGSCVFRVCSGSPSGVLGTGFNGKSVSAQQASTTSSPDIVFLSFLFLSPRSGPSRPGYKTLPVPFYLSFLSSLSLFSNRFSCTSTSTSMSTFFLSRSISFSSFSLLSCTSLVQTCRFTVTLQYPPLCLTLRAASAHQCAREHHLFPSPGVLSLRPFHTGVVKSEA